MSVSSQTATQRRCIYGNDHKSFKFQTIFTGFAHNRRQTQTIEDRPKERLNTERKRHRPTKHPGLYLKRGLKRIEILEKSEHSLLGPSLPQQAISLLALQTLHSSQSFSKTGLQSSRRSRQSIIVVLLEREIRIYSDAYNWSWPAFLTSSFSPTGCTLGERLSHRDIDIYKNNYSMF